MSQKGAGPRTKDCRVQGSPPRRRGPRRGFLLLLGLALARVGTSSHTPSAHQPVVQPLTPRDARIPEARFGGPPPLGARPLFPSGAGPVIALTGPWGRGSPVLVHMSQVSRAETSGRATSHSLGLVCAPHKPLPARSWHRQPEAPGSCTAPVPAAPPAPAQPQRAAPSFPPRCTGAGSACPGEGPPAGSPGPWKAAPPPADPHPGRSQILSRRNLSSPPPCLPAVEGGREMPGWRPLACPPGTGAQLHPPLHGTPQGAHKEHWLWSGAGVSQVPALSSPFCEGL